MKKGIAIISILALFIATGCATQATTGEENLSSVASISEDGYQEITLSYGKVGYSYNYILTPNTVKVGIPVRMTANMKSLNGCYRSLRVPEYGISKYLSNSDNNVEFTPEETGGVLFTCSMGMGTATLNVI